MRERTRYRTIVADPPWEIGDFPANLHVKNGGTNPLPYPTMTVSEIKALPVNDMAAPACDLYLWTINEYVEAAYDTARAWGFDPVALMVWCKAPKGRGLGGKWPSNVEFILYATRRVPRPNFEDEIRLATILREAKLRTGKRSREIDEHFGTANVSGHWFTPHGHRVNVPTLEQWEWLREWLGLTDNAEVDALVRDLNARKGERFAPEMRRGPGRWFEWPRGAHSAKPEAFLDLVEQVSDGPYLEMFARRNRLGWDTWGDQCLTTAEMAA